MRRRTRPRAVLGVLAMLAILVVAGPVRAADETVTIADFAFSPPTVTIDEGDSVTWTNGDGVSHTATGSGFDTEQIGAGESSTITFPTAGAFAYACAIHPQMTGQVVVEAAAPAPTDPPAPTTAPAPTEGDGGTAVLTPAPTDTEPAEGAGTLDDTTVVAILLALLGATMLVGTWWFDPSGRRSRTR